MLCLMPYECIGLALEDKQAQIYNLTAIGENVRALGLVDLAPYLIVNPYYLMDIGKSYEQYIFEDDARFATFFSIIHKLFNGYNVYLLKTSTDAYDEAIENFQRLVFGRYGIHTVIINSVDDIEDCIIYNDDTDVAFGNGMSVSNYDIDVARYTDILNYLHDDQ